MDFTRLDDEHLEAIWLLEEKNQTQNDALEIRLGDQYSEDVLNKLRKRGLVKDLQLTETGKEYTARLIRAHRLAERLLKDVLGINDYEVGACEFEHIMNNEILNGLCTLLGHPTKCPHGLSIPPGECCRRGEKQVNQAVHSLSSLNPGDSLKILYIQTINDRELHILEGMRVRPGVVVKVHQTKPALVIECEGTHIALDESVGEKILGLLTKSTEDTHTLSNPDHIHQGRGRRGRGRVFNRHKGRRQKYYTPE
jgi:DtxR family Mn-dependent transcriptional regulator